MIHMSESEFAAMKGKPKRSKYGAKRTVSGFDSRKEEKRYGELRLLERAGKISELHRQVRYALVVGHTLICEYVADFQYRRDGLIAVEDVKGVRTRDYIIKRKLMLALYGITIEEI